MSTATTSANIPVEKKPGVRHILDNTKYPDYIRNHSVFHKLNKITKVFEGIGLPNTTEECVYSNIVEARQDAQNLLYSDIRGGLYGAMYVAHISRNLQALLIQVHTAIGSYYPSMILEEDGKLVLKFIGDTGADPTTGKVFAKKGESVFKVYNKLIEKCKENQAPGAEGVLKPITLTALESLPYFKAFSATNVPGGRKFKTVFSASGQEGVWDIATISMRGISSCQSWGTPQSRGLIGSISSKYVGVIYLTSGEPFNEYGSKMVRRAMVRFCVNKNTKKPALLVDKVYPGDDLAARTIFREFLKTKVDMPILFPGEPTWHEYYLPVDSYISSAPLQANEYTYMDTKITWKNALPIQDTTAFYQRIAHLDTELATAVNRTVFKMLDEYCFDKKTHRAQFRGGVANLLLAMKKHVGSSLMGVFLPKLYSNCTAMQPIRLLPAPEQFATASLYEKAVIKGVFQNIKVFDAKAKAHAHQMGKFIKFFPTSLDKLITFAMTEYKKELVKRYKILINQC